MGRQAPAIMIKAVAAEQGASTAVLPLVVAATGAATRARRCTWQSSRWAPSVWWWGRPGDHQDVFLDAAPVLEELGYATIWLAGPSITGFQQVRSVVGATRNVQIAGGVILVDQFDPAEVAAWYAEIQATHPGRFIVGLGGARMTPSRCRR
jgi:Luciferase-like monooxygenase